MGCSFDLACIPATKTKARSMISDGSWRLTDARRTHAHVLDDEANAFAATHRVPKVRVYASVWFRKCWKKRKLS